MSYLLLSLMFAILICACVSIGAFMHSFAGGNKRSFIAYKLFGGIAYTLLGFSGLVINRMLEGAQSFYIPVLAVAFILLGIWMVRGAAKARSAQ